MFQNPISFLSRALFAAALFSSTSHAADTPDRPLHILFIGDAKPVNAGNDPGTYAFLPGQTLAKEAIYFDYAADAAALTPAYLQHVDAVLEVGREIPAEQKKALDAFAAAGHGVKMLPATARADDAQLRVAALDAVGQKARTEWEAFIRGRAPLTYQSSPDVANYERRPAALPVQQALPALESMKYTQVPADFDLKLFASDPDIFKPIAMAWDERGRLWIAETRDYPNEVRPAGQGDDDIKICEDTDGDGRADKFTVFADHLNIPTSLTFVNGGVMVAQAPDFLFLKDTNGDDKADVRQVIFHDAWGVNDTHAGPSNLHYGFDNWLYGSVGYAGFASKSGPVNSFRQGLFRFRPDGSAIEFLAQFSNNTWGFGYNDAGDIFGSTANNAPSFFNGLPQSDFPPGVRLMSAKRINTFDKIHPNTANIRQVDVMGGFTAAAGHMFMNSGALPERLRGKALVAEPTCKLLSIFDVQRDGAGFKSNDGGNLVASTDECMSPVAAEVGPDGAVWVADWYNFIIQHNPTPSPERGGYKAETGKGGAHINPNRDTVHGRIYRVVWKDGTASQIKSLSGAPVGDLVKSLASDNQFWRLTAQRLLVDRKKKEAVPALTAMATKGSDVGAIHALWTLSGIGALDAATHRAALLSKDPEIRRNAIRALGTDEAARQLYFSTSVLHDADLTTRLAAFVKLAEFPTSPEIKTLVSKLSTDAQNKSDEWLAEGINLLAKKHGVESFREGPNLLPNPGFETTGPDGLPQGWARRDYGNRDANKTGKWESVSGAGDTHSGLRALRCITYGDADTSMHADVTLKPHTRYKLAAWIKTHALRGKASLNDHIGRAETGKLTAADSPWTEVETTFDSGDRTTASINILHVAKGDSYFDDVRLCELMPADAANAVTIGDPARGDAIFHTHPLAICITCHAVGGKGGNVGPALDGIASRKDEAYITESLLEPNAKLAEGFQGQVSPMPPMGLILKDQELADVKAYLLTLKAK